MDYSLIVHGGFWLHNMYAGQYLFKELEGHAAAVEANKFAFRFITSWNMMAQWVFLSIALYLDILKYLPTSKRREYLDAKLRIAKGYLYTVIVFPISLGVSSMFWSLHTLDEDYIMEGLRHFIPKWLNHSIHTNIIFVVFAELLLSKCNMPKPSFKTAMTILVAYGFIYCIQYLTIYYQYGRFLYGVFYLLSWPERLGLLALFNVLNVGYLKMGYVLQNWRSSTNNIKCD